MNGHTNGLEFLFCTTDTTYKDFSYSIVAAINNCLNSRYREATPWEMHPGMVS